MKEKILFRHNIMTINSIQTFVSIRGAFAGNQKDVYFVRAIGEPVDLSNQINLIDKQMGIEMEKNHLKYTRINALPQIRDTKVAEYYSVIYEQWKNGGDIKLKQVLVNSELQGVLQEAYSQVLDYYTKTKQNISDSMTKNFATKLLFWLDETMKNLLSEWNVKDCLKVIADNVVKDQEYLFYLLLTYLGCDVLLIENREDVVASNQLKQFSCTLELGGFGQTCIAEYIPYIVKKEENKKTSDVQKNTPNIVTIPEHPRRKKVQQTVPNQSKPSESTNNVTNATEKSYEELAQLASSIVLIAIHDNNGEVIGTGSGIMIGREGYILTNNHVASGGQFYSVRIEDDEEVYKTDEVIKYNYATDLAVIRIRRHLNPLPIYRGKEKLVRGQRVVAIGSPLGLFNSVSDGIISGFRNINDVDMIQFTAPISHGSSGGAVLNMYGEVIGISTAGIDSGQNINLAVGYESIWAFAKGFIDHV